MKFSVSLKAVSITILVFCLLFDYGLCFPKKKKGKQKTGVKNKANKKQSKESTLEDEIHRLKISRYPCFYNWASDMPMKQLLKRFHDCRPKYDAMIEERLNQLGVVGDAIQTWLDITEIYLINEFPFRLIEKDFRKDKEKASYLLSTFKDIDTASKKILEYDTRYMHANERGIEFEDNYEIEALRYKRYSLVQNSFYRAYHLGQGLCTHFKEYPLKLINKILDEVEFSVDRDTLSSYTSEVLARETSTGITNPTGRYLFLRYLCRNLRVFPSYLRKLYFGTPKYYPDEERRTYIEAAINAFLKEGPNYIFNLSDLDDEIDINQNQSENSGKIDSFKSSSEYFDKLLKEEHEFQGNESSSTSEPMNVLRNKPCAFGNITLVSESIDNLKPDRDPKYKQYLITLNAIGSFILRECIRDVDPAVQELIRELKTTENYKKCLPFMEKLTNFVHDNEREFSEKTVLRMLNVRSEGVMAIETDLFFNKKANETLNLIEAYKTGKDMCDVFSTKEWAEITNNDNKLLELFEQMAEFFKVPKFRTRIRHDSIELFYLWTVCSEIKLLPIDDSGSSST